MTRCVRILTLALAWTFATGHVFSITETDSYASPQLIHPLLQYDIFAGGAISVSAQLHLAVQNAPASSLNISRAFALTICPSAIMRQIELGQPSGPGINPIHTELCSRTSIVDNRQPSRPATSDRCGVTFFAPVESNSSDPSGVGSVITVNPSFHISEQAIVLPTTDEWTVSMTACGMIQVQERMLQFNAEHEACMQAAITQGQVPSNVTVNGRTVDCGQRADPFSWRLAATVGLTPTQPDGETIEAGEVGLQYTRPALLLAELAVFGAFAIRTLAAQSHHSIRLQLALCAVLLLHVISQILSLAMIRALASGSMFSVQRGVLQPLRMTATSAGLLALALAGYLTGSGWQTLFLGLPPTGIRVGIVASLCGAVGLLVPAILSQPDRPPLTANLQPPIEARQTPRPDADGPELGPWLAATIIGGMTCVMLGMYSLWYVVNMAVASARYRLETATRRAGSPMILRFRQLLKKQLQMLRLTRRDVGLITLVWCISGIAGSVGAGAVAYAWVWDLARSLASVLFLASIGYRFRGRLDPSFATVRPAPTAGATEVDGATSEAATDREAAAAATAIRLLSVRGVDPVLGPVETRELPLSHVVMRLLARDSPPELQAARIRTRDLEIRRVAALPPPITLIRLPDCDAADLAEPAEPRSQSNAVIGVAPVTLKWLDSGGLQSETVAEPPRTDASVKGASAPRRTSLPDGLEPVAPRAHDFVIPRLLRLARSEAQAAEEAAVLA